MNFSSYEQNFDENLNEMLDTFNKQINVIEVQNIYVYFFYIIQNTCDIYKRIIIPLSNGVLTKENLMTEIVKNRNESGRRFNVSGINKYNFDTTNLKDFLNNGTVMDEYKNVENISFNNSIDYFEHHNSLFVFLTNEKNKNTKKSGPTNKHKTLKSN
jgi:hypothetical protein